MAWLSRWNRLPLIAWPIVPPAVFYAYVGIWAGFTTHGPPRTADYTLYVSALSVLILCGVLGGLAAFGVGCRGGERPRGRILGGLLVPIGLLAAGAMVHHLRVYGWPG